MLICTAHNMYSDVLYSSGEPGELLQQLCHDNSTINIGLGIIIIITVTGNETWIHQRDPETKHAVKT